MPNQKSYTLVVEIDRFCEHYLEKFGTLNSRLKGFYIKPNKIPKKRRKMQTKNRVFQSIPFICSEIPLYRLETTFIFNICFEEIFKFYHKPLNCVQHT